MNFFFTFLQKISELFREEPKLLSDSGSLQIQSYNEPQKVIYLIFLPQGQLSYL